MRNEKINLAEKLAQFSEHWAPRTVAQLNDYDVMVVKVQGEVREETHLHVQVGQHLLDDPDMPGGSYQHLHTYLCHVIDGEAQPGYEPEDEAAEDYAIIAVCWFDLRQPATWGMDVQSDPITYPLLQRLRAALRYPEEEQ